MYKVLISDRAQDEFVKSVAWYNENSLIAAKNFKQSLKNAVALIAANPKSFPNPVRNYHQTHLYKFPFTLVYRINENKKEVLLVSIFHQKRNPTNKFK